MKTVFIFLVALSINQVTFSQATDSTKSQPPALSPGMNGPLTANPDPLKFKAGRFGDIYVSGVVSGLLQGQTNVFPGDKKFQSDINNSQVFIQKIDGVLQFFVQAGGYSLPALGATYLRSIKAIGADYGLLPQWYLKIAPTKHFSILAGNLPTLIGAEYTFSFENMNIEGGLLWNQENAVNRGVQINYNTGPLTFALSYNDGFYSKKYSWLTGSVIYAINSNNTIALIGGGNTVRTNISTSATPLYQNNQQIYNLIYTHTASLWTLSSYLQYTHVPQSILPGTSQDAATYGAAVFVKYTAPHSGFSLPARLEYINTTGSIPGGSPNILYGVGSNAWSITLTPSYQYKRFFGRTEFSFVQANKVTDGSVFGPNGTDKTQARVLFEIGVLF